MSSKEGKKKGGTHNGDVVNFRVSKMNLKTHGGNIVCLLLRCNIHNCRAQSCKGTHHVTEATNSIISPQGAGYLVTLLRLCLIFTTSEINSGSFTSPHWLPPMTDNGCCLSPFIGQLLPVSQKHSYRTWRSYVQLKYTNTTVRVHQFGVWFVLNI